MEPPNRFRERAIMWRSAGGSVHDVVWFAALHDHAIPGLMTLLQQRFDAANHNDVISLERQIAERSARQCLAKCNGKTSGQQASLLQLAAEAWLESNPNDADALFVGAIEVVEALDA